MRSPKVAFLYGLTCVVMACDSGPAIIALTDTSSSLPKLNLGEGQLTKKGLGTVIFIGFSRPNHPSITDQAEVFNLFISLDAGNGLGEIEVANQKAYLFSSHIFGGSFGELAVEKGQLKLNRDGSYTFNGILTGDVLEREGGSTFTRTLRISFSSIPLARKEFRESALAALKEEEIELLEDAFGTEWIDINEELGR